eukprot:SAG31_NODE_22230_length_530_cov_207.656613_2_plen_49_part_01
MKSMTGTKEPGLFVCPSEFSGPVQTTTSSPRLITVSFRIRPLPVATTGS